MNPGWRSILSIMEGLFVRFEFLTVTRSPAMWYLVLMTFVIIWMNILILVPLWEDVPIGSARDDSHLKEGSINLHKTLVPITCMEVIAVLTRFCGRLLQKKPRTRFL